MRAIRTLLRTFHLAAFAALYGGHIYGVEAGRLEPALIATLTTGGVFLAFEVWRAPVWLIQLRGVLTFVKIALVAAVGVFWEARIVLLSLALALGAVSSHMPGRFRYYSVLHRRVVGPREKG